MSFKHSTIQFATMTWARIQNSLSVVLDYLRFVGMIFIARISGRARNYSDCRPMGKKCQRLSASSSHTTSTMRAFFFCNWNSFLKDWPIKLKSWESTGNNFTVRWVLFETTREIVSNSKVIRLVVAQMQILSDLYII